MPVVGVDDVGASWRACATVTRPDAIRDGERQFHNAEGQLQFGRAAARETLRLELIAKALDIARESASRLGDDVDRRLTGDVVESLERGGGN